MKKILFISCMIILTACNNKSGESGAAGTEQDTTMKSIDSSAIINNATQLPRDSTATGVQH